MIPTQNTSAILYLILTLEIKFPLPHTAIKFSKIQTFYQALNSRSFRSYILLGRIFTTPQVIYLDPQTDTAWIVQWVSYFVDFEAIIHLVFYLFFLVE